MGSPAGDFRASSRASCIACIGECPLVAGPRRWPRLDAKDQVL
jgi:hypothetical protein